MSAYRQSQELIDEAEVALRRGNAAEAEALFTAAAVLQGKMVSEAPADRVKTKSAFAVSVATLYLRANRLDESERAAHGYMVEPWLNALGRERLRDVLVRVWNERLLAKMTREA